MNLFYARTYTVVSGHVHREILTVVNANQITNLMAAEDFDPEEMPPGVIRIGLSDGTGLFVKGGLEEIAEKIARRENLL